MATCTGQKLAERTATLIFVLTHGILVLFVIRSVFFVCVCVHFILNQMVLKPACLSIIYEASHAASRLPGFELNHVNRDRNLGADDLAQMAKHLNHSAVRRGCYPNSIEQLIALDCNISMSNQ